MAERVQPERPVNLLPGPVKIEPAVHAAFARTAVSHRGAEFGQVLRWCRQSLCALTNAPHVALIVGSGTLANDVVGLQIGRLGTRGLVLRNGEFGGRLTDHARRLGLEHDVVTAGWGEVLPLGDVERRLAEDGSIGWVWAVHCETSTSVLNDLEALKDLTRRHGAKLIMDCTSSIGAVPVDLEGVHLAGGASGKALASYAGLSIVFHAEAVVSDPALPRYLDLGAYTPTEGVPFTSSSNLVFALAAALERFRSPDGGPGFSVDAVHRRKVALARLARRELGAMGYAVIGDEETTSPAVISFSAPPAIDSMHLGEYLDRHEVLLSYRSRYLVERNVLQICLMGEHTESEIAYLFDHLRAYDADRPEH